MHPDQLVVSVDTVRELVDLQFPRWRNEPIRRIASTGTVNAIFRIGERWTARFGLVRGDVESVHRAQPAGSRRVGGELFERSEHFLDVARLRRIWRVIRDTSRGPGGDVMSHGDLIPGNVLVASGRLAGVIDVGGVGPADPALDLVGAWHLLEAGPRQVLREDLGCADHEWARGRAWAFVQALGVWYYADSNPSMYRMGLRTLHRIMADESSGA